MEMLRIFSMFLIVFYHLVCFFVVKLRVEDSNWTAIQPCAHKGVILFVLISGYYGIKTKIKGVLHILLPCVIYYVPVSMFSVYLIHHQPFLMQYVIQPIVSKVESFCNGDISLFVGLVMTTSIIMVCCVTIDFMIKPIFSILEKVILQRVHILKKHVDK